MQQGSHNANVSDKLSEFLVPLIMRPTSLRYQILKQGSAETVGMEPFFPFNPVSLPIIGPATLTLVNNNAQGGAQNGQAPDSMYLEVHLQSIASLLVSP